MEHQAGDELHPRTVRSQTYESENNILGLNGIETPALLAAAWTLLVSLSTGRSRSSAKIACRTDTPNQRPDLLDITQYEIDVDWTQSISELLDQAKVELDKSEAIQSAHKSKRLSITKPSRSSHWSEQSLLLYGSSSSDSEIDLNDPSHSPARLMSNSRYSLVLAPQISKEGCMTTTAFVEDSSLTSKHVLQLLRQYCHLVGCLRHAEHTHALNTLDLLDKKEKQHLFETNSTVPPAIEDCVHHVIVRQARLRPESQAVCAWDGDFTYSQLMEFSRRLARHLAFLGIGPGKTVVVCFEKSKWAAVAIVAILQAGGAIVMIDPGSSSGAAEGIITTSGAMIALTDTGRLPFMQRLVEHVLAVDTDSIAGLPEEASNLLPTKANPDDTAWIVFTSGSTGKPKGVVLSHSALCTGALANGKVKYMNHNTRTFQFSSFVFDGAIQDYVFTWYHGGCVCIPSERDRTENIAGVMNELQVNWTFLTPSVVSLLSPGDVPALKVLALGGEALSSENVKNWVGSVTLLNAYGPAECTVACAVGEFTDPDDDARNIGRSVGSLLWICNPDFHDQLVPQGCVGELLVEGPMLARGYLGDPETTARAFIESPKWVLRDDHTIRRFYKTGDLVRQEPDGSLIYLGRRDDQVKLHGQRITLGGVNDFIARDPSVKHSFLAVPQAGLLQDSLVCVLSLKQRDSSPHNARPLAAISEFAKPEVEETIAMLKHRMADSFASYMVPSMWLPVQDLPLSNSGKIDGTKIKRWLELEYEAPQVTDHDLTNVDGLSTALTDSEEALQEAWCKVLDIQPHSVGKQSSFFDLGGNSLKAMALATHLRKAGVTLAVTDVLRSPNLADMAKCISNDVDRDKIQAREVSLTTIRRESIAADCGVNPDQIEDIYPAAPIQEALLTLTTKQPEAYVVHRKFSIPDSIDVVQLRAAWMEACRANSILRTRLLYSPDHATVQVVIKDDFWWREKDESNDEDWTFGSPLLRIHLAGRILQVSIHHSLFDGWSIPLILKDVEQAYHRGPPAPRPGFKSFVGYLKQLDHSKSEAYWASHLSEISAAVFPSSPDSSHKPVAMSSIRRTISSSHNGAFSGVTPATLATAAWAIVLSKYTGMDDVCFGLITSGRFIPLEGVRDIIGPLVATTPFRTVIDPMQPIEAFLKHLQEALVDMVPHVHFGLQRIRDISPEMREAAKFNNTLVVHPEHESNESTIMRPADTEDFNMGDYYTYPLNMVCTITKDGFDAEMHSHAGVVSGYQAGNLMNYFERVLGAMASCEQETAVKKIAQVSIPAPLHRPSTETLRVERCVHDLISSQAKEQPNAEAICSWDRNLSYAEVDSLSRRLAVKLISLGVARGMHVCFSFEKSSLPVIAMLAIMKAGAACVPLDISYPTERVKIVVGKCRPKLIVCSAEQAEMLAKLGEPRVLVIDHDMLAQLPDEAEWSNSPVKPDDLCYTLFTSGSTGEPKGVMWTHRTLSSSSTAHGGALYITSASRVFQFSAFMWDISVCETLTTLIHGGCICVPSEAERLDNTLSSMNCMRVNWAWFTPSFARSIDLTGVENLDTLVLGGEVIGQDNVERYRRCLRLLTGYGPTECCVAVSVADFSEDERKKSGNIGTGVGCNLWIADPNDANVLVPEGAVGEILIEGPIVGSGYIEEAEKTTEVFAEKLHWATGRFYRSGDLGQMNEDGTVTFLGRKDDQVKVRGQRLELGEVEHHLLRSPGVQHAMAFVPSSNSYKGRLVAVISTIPQGHESVSLEPVEDSQLVYDMQEALATKLPPFGVPSVWLVVEALPLTAARKLDRVKIRRWVLDHLEGSSSSVYDGEGYSDKAVITPSTRHERLLQRAWADVLQRPIEAVGVNQSFLELGGDSIQAIRLVSLLRSQDLTLTVSSVFRNPVLKDMALSISMSSNVIESSAPFSLLPDAVDRTGVVTDAARLCGVAESVVQDIYPATPLQEAVMALDTIRPGSYFAQLVYRCSHDLQADRLRKAWKAVVAMHTILRSRLVHLPQLGTMQVLLDCELPFEQAHSLETYLENDGCKMIGLGDPMARLAVAGQDIVLTAHHAAYDGFSLPMIMDDLMHAYQEEETIPRLPFKNFVQYLNADDIKASEAFWTSNLSGLESSDFPRASPPGHQINSNASQSKTIISDQFAKEQDSVTMATVAHASWALVLAAYGDAEDVCFGTTLSGRDIPMADISRLPGPTLATVPLRHRIDRSSPVSSLLQQVQAGTLDVMEHQHLGLQHIKRINPEACDFGTMFVVFPRVEEDNGSWALRRDVSTGYLDNFSMYPLAVLFQQREGGPQVTINYDSTIFSEKQIGRILNTFRDIFSRLLSDKGGASVQEVLQPSPEDFAEVKTWNVDPPTPVQGFVHEKVSAKSSKTHSAPAICAWDGDFTYQELEEWSNRLSYDLSTRGVGPGMFVAFCCVKSKWTIVVIMAILKAKAAFVPFNPDDSMERKRRLVTQCGVQTLITSASIYEEHKELAPTVLQLDESYLRGLPRDGKVSRERLTAHSPAWMIFTSGSTGVPKAPVISHEGFTTSITALAKALDLSQKTRMLQFASHVFDLSLLEIMAPLIMGGCVCIPSDDERMDSLAAAAARMHVNTTVMTPTLLRSLKVKDFPGFETVILGGENVGADLIERWGSRVKLFSVWAPSETTIANTVVRLTKSEQTGELGDVINARCWLVQSNDVNSLACIGAPGEIVVEGPCVAQGYHNDQERTSTAFFESLKWAKSGSRFYRTGDMAKYDDQGNLYFAGRRDGQVKVRGQRIEIDEVEHHLYANSEISHAVVMVPKTGGLAGSLVAVISLGAEHDDSLSDTLVMRDSPEAAAKIQKIEHRLFEVLAKHAVPSVFLPIRKMPQTASGKVDRVRVRHWLAGMDPTRQANPGQQKSVRSPPKTDVERQLQQIWSQVLNVSQETIGRDTSFFQLGGDSITAMQAVSSCRSAGVGLTVQTIMRSKTIAKIAEQVGSTPEVKVKTSKEQDDGKAFALSPIQEIYASCGAVEHRFNQSMLLRCNIEMDLKSLREALAVVIDYHPMLRLRLQRKETDGVWEQIVVPRTDQDICAFATTSRSDANMEAAMEQAQSYVNVQKGPILAAALIRRPSGSVLFLTSHHMAIDLVSWRTLIQHVELALHGKPMPRQVSLSFSQWQKHHSEHVGLLPTKSRQLPFEVPRADIDFWGMAHKSNVTQDTILHSFVLDRETTELLKGKANRAFETETIDLLIAAISLSFAETFSDRPTPAIYNEVHGREPWDSSVDLSQTVGWFTALQPLALDSKNTTSLIDIVKRAKDIRKSLSSAEWVSVFTNSGLSSQLETLLGGGPPVEIVLNFAGTFQQLERSDGIFQLIPGARSGDHGERLQRLGLFEFGAMMSNEQLHVSLTSNKHVQHQNRVELWMIELKKSLSSIASILSTREPEFTISDFPLLKDSQGMMDRLSAEVFPLYTSGNVRDTIEDVYPCPSIPDAFLCGQRFFNPRFIQVQWTVKLTASKGQPCLDANRILASWKRVVDRYDALRSVFAFLPGPNSQHQQIVLRSCEPKVFQLEASTAEEACRVIQNLPIKSYDFHETQHSFAVCSTPTGEVHCRLEVNHAITDGASMSLLWNELSREYNNLPPNGPAPPYSDYVAFVKSQPLDENTAYWSHYLKDAKPGFLPKGPQPDETLEGYGIADCSSKVNVTALQQVCKNFDVTVPALLQTAWGLLIAARSGEPSACFAYANSGRESEIPNIQNMIGSLITVLACWMPLQANESFRALVSRVHEDHHSHVQRQHFRFTDVTPGLDSLTNSATSIQAMGTLFPGPESGIVFEHVHAMDSPSDDYLFTGSYGKDDISLLIKYHRSRTTEEWGKGLAEDYASLLNAIIEGPEEDYMPYIERISKQRGVPGNDRESSD